MGSYTGRYGDSVMHPENLAIIDTMFKRVIKLAGERGLKADCKALRDVCTANGCPVTYQFMYEMVKRAENVAKCETEGKEFKGRIYPLSIEVITSLIRGYNLNYSDFFVL